MTHNLKQKIFTLITKLGDRDTYNLAVTELISIAESLDPSTSSLQVFLSCLLVTGSSDKPAVRRQCLSLISLLAECHGNSLSPHLSKIVSHLTRRLRDHDSATRSACVSAVAVLSSRVTRTSFSTAFLKPLSEALFTEQEVNTQIGAALCLAAAIDGAPEVDAVRLGKIVPRLERLLKSENFRGKTGVLVVIGSVIGSGGVSDGLNTLVNCLMGFLSNEDWAARKAAAEALGRLAATEKDTVAEFKAGCMKVFESRKFDKVKTVREAMNQMIEVWRDVPDLLEESKLMASSRDNSSGPFPPGSKNSQSHVHGSVRMRNNSSPATMKTPLAGSYASTSRKSSALKSTARKTSPAMLRNNPLDTRVNVADTFKGVHEDDLNETDENNLETGYKKQETKRALFMKNSEDKTHKISGLRSGSRIAPCHAESPQPTVAISNGSENIRGNHKENEDISSIRNQLVQIEKQQSSLVDLLQSFMGNSQNGMRSLETRVHGLEMALDGISYDLAVASKSMSDFRGTRCCLLPGANFFSSKFWKKPEAPRLSTSHGNPSLASRHQRTDASCSTQTFNLENCRLRLQGGGGFIVNPLAEIHSGSMGVSEQ